MKRLLVVSMVAWGGFGQTIQVHGHRGARAMRPENTLPAFEYAIAQGVDALELDMAVTKDNVIVVSTSDGKGVPMRKDEPARSGRRTKGEKANRKRMACVGAVYSI